MDIQVLKNIRRLSRIVRILIKYGFGGLVAQMRIFPFVSTLLRAFVPRKRLLLLSVPERIRLVLEELGPTFIKLGQIASTRADLLPPDWVEELKKLQDMVPPFPFEEARKVVEKSLRGSLEDKFAAFESTPVASASIAQVHLAELRTGERVAVKVKRPGIGRIIAADMAVMHTVATLLEKYVPLARRYRPTEVVTEFERVITDEQDLTKEGDNIDRFFKIFEKNPGVQIPRVYWDLTTEDVLVMERIYGTPIDEVERIREKGLDIKAIAVRGVELFFQQVFEHGIFHADLHPGNIFVRDDGAIIYLDFGIIGKLDRGLRRYLANILFHMVRRDYHRMALVHREMGLIGEEVNIYEFEEALRDITEPIHGRPLEMINISALLMKLVGTARRFQMTLQPNLLLLQKSMLIIEGVGRQLYPDVNMWEVAKPLIYRWMAREHLGPRALFEKGTTVAEKAVKTAYELPVNANDVLEKALRGRLRFGFEHSGLDEVTHELETAGRRVGGGVIVGAIVVSATLFAVFSEEPAAILGVPVISAAGYVLAAFLGLKLFAGRG